MITHLFLILALILTNNLSANDAACATKQFADACTCGNTQWQGYCLPGSHSKNDEDLYCDCESDTLTAEDVTYEAIKKFCNNIQVRTTLQQFLTHYDSDWLAHTNLYRNLNTIYSKVKADPSSERLRNPDIRENLVAVDKILVDNPRFIKSFFIAKDNCDYLDQPCTCSNTRRQGVCSIAASQTVSGGKVTRRVGDTMFCHCG